MQFDNRNQSEQQQEQQQQRDSNKKLRQFQGGDFQAADVKEAEPLLRKGHHEAAIPEVAASGTSYADVAAGNNTAPAGLEDATTQEAAAAAVSQKPGQHKREHRLDVDSKAEQSAMYNQNRLDKAPAQSHNVPHKQAFNGAERGQAERDQSAELGARHIGEQRMAERESEGGANVPLAKGEALLGGGAATVGGLRHDDEAISRKEQHIKLDQKQLRKLEQSLEESEKPAVTQRREERRSGSSTSSSSTRSSEKGDFGEAGALRKEGLGDIAQKQVQHTSPQHKKERLRESIGEEQHQFAPERQHETLKQQQGAKGRREQQKGERLHRKREEKPREREASPASTTSSSASEPDAHEKLHELTDKKLPRDQVRDQEALEGRGQLKKHVQAAQMRQTELPTKERFSESDKGMSSKLGAQIPAKQDAKPQAQKQADVAQPSQKNNMEL